MPEITNSPIKPSASVKRAIKALEAGVFRKIICGAANTSEKQVERLALVYSLAGVHVIDIAPEQNIYHSAKKGIKKAFDISKETPVLYPDFHVPTIMTSINAGDDKHFRKSAINMSKCMECLECVKTCPSTALTEKDGKVNTEYEKCYGCALCVEVCQHNAVNMVKMPDNFKKDAFYLEETPSAVEIHTGNANIEELRGFLELYNSVIKNALLVSVSIDSTRFNRKEFVDYTKAVIRMFDKKIIIQADGLAMRGGSKKSSTLETIASAGILLDENIDAYIQLSGGTNHLSRTLAEMAGLKISGIGYGSFAKKVILTHITEHTEDEFMRSLRKIVDVAGNLLNG